MLVSSEGLMAGLAAMNAMVAGSDESGGGETAMTVAVAASDEQDGGRLHVTTELMASSRHHFQSLYSTDLPYQSLDALDELNMQQMKQQGGLRRLPLQYMREIGDSEDLYPYDETSINELVAERAAQRCARNWQAADELKGKLSDMGVTIDDVHLTWYVSPRPQQNQQATGYIPSGRQSASREGAMDINARLPVDRLYAELCARGIGVCDTTKCWRADGKLFEVPSELALEYARVPGDGDSDEVDETEILSLIAARLAAKKQRDYGRSDRIAEQLKESHSVLIDDKRRTWRVVQFSGGYVRVGPTVGKALDKICKLVAQRSARIESHGVGDAQAVRLMGQLEEMGVEVDDQRKNWKRPRRTLEQKMKDLKKPTKNAKSMDTKRNQKLKQNVKRKGRSKASSKKPESSQSTGEACAAA
ncbi:MAG: hypothetical protein SGPRY_000717 [Prymnesium sp.]